MFWCVIGASALLVVVRAWVQYTTAKRRLGALSVVVDEHGLATRTRHETHTILRLRIARIVEIDGALGGLRIEFEPEGGDGVTMVTSIPRGGTAFADVRARLEQWRPIERRRRKGPARRLVLGGAIVAAIYFLPFVLDDLAARSKLLIATFVVLSWMTMRWAMRSR
jgi:hypothetical protein